jgi:PilZ domain
MKSSDVVRRRHRRHAVQLQVTLRFKPPRALREKQADLMLIGRTKDLCEGGLAVIVSASNIDRYLKQQENSFQVELKLPDGSLSFEVTPVHFNRFMTATGASYVIGSRLSKLEPPQLARLMAYLKSLPLI